MTEQHKEYLDNLRESGVINMFGASLYLVRDFPELSSKEAKTVLSEWMRTFGN
jgi:hypothetical protein